MRRHQQWLLHERTLPLPRMLRCRLSGKDAPSPMLQRQCDEAPPPTLQGGRSATSAHRRQRSSANAKEAPPRGSAEGATPRTLRPRRSFAEHARRLCQRVHAHDAPRTTLHRQSRSAAKAPWRSLRR